MQLADRWDVIAGRLPRDWSEARLTLTVDDSARADRAAALLGGLNPGRLGTTFRFEAAAPGGGPTGNAVRRALALLDGEGIAGRLALDGAVEALPREDGVARHASLAAQWEALEAQLPPDWSDALLEVELASSADIEHAALLLGPVNPLLVTGTQILRFRAARRFGYGAAPQMVRRTLARLDDAQIAGKLRLLGLLSDTRPVATQGPVWRIGGRAV